MSGTTDTRSSYSNFSEDFAQSQDTAENWDPSDEAFAREGQSLLSDLNKSVELLDAARRVGSIEEIEAAEKSYEDLALRWVGYQETLKEDLLSRPGYLSISQALGCELETGAELSSEAAHARRDALEVMVEYVMQEGVANLGGAFKNFLALVRKIKPEKLEGISQSDLAKLLGETKAATSAREKSRVENVAKKMGVQGFHFLGGSKSETTRSRSAKAAQNNTNRRDGTRKRRL